jgi:lysylphosphatidylglycerol synthase-like protein
VSAVVASPRLQLPRWLRDLLPWLLGLAIVAWLFQRVPVRSVAAALAGGPWVLLAVYVAFELAVLLPMDAWSTRVTLRQCGGSPPFRDVLAMRGATYILNLLHYAAGQGAFGWYLTRGGRTGWSAAGALLLLFVTQGLALVLVIALGMLVAPAWLWHIALPVAAIMLVGVVVYAAILARPPAWLRRMSLLQPLFAAGLRGHAVAVAARVPHMAILVLLNWGLYRVWGMPVPLRVGVALWPVLLTVSALPITPSGLGTVQALQLAWFSEWAAGGTRAAREASVLALTLASYALSLALQAVIGAVCVRYLRRSGVHEKATPEEATSPRDTPLPY